MTMYAPASHRPSRFSEHVIALEIGMVIGWVILLCTSCASPEPLDPSLFEGGAPMCAGCLDTCGNAKSDVEAYRCVWACGELCARERDAGTGRDAGADR